MRPRIVALEITLGDAEFRFAECSAAGRPPRPLDYFQLIQGYIASPTEAGFHLWEWQASGCRWALHEGFGAEELGDNTIFTKY